MILPLSTAVNGWGWPAWCSPVPMRTFSWFGQEGRHFAVCLFAHTKSKGTSIFSRSTENGPAFPSSSRAHRRSASPLPGGRGWQRRAITHMRQLAQAGSMAVPISLPALLFRWMLGDGSPGHRKNGSARSVCVCVWRGGPPLRARPEAPTVQTPGSSGDNSRTYRRWTDGRWVIMHMVVGIALARWGSVSVIHHPSSHIYDHHVIIHHQQCPSSSGPPAPRYPNLPAPGFTHPSSVRRRVRRPPPAQRRGRRNRLHPPRPAHTPVRLRRRQCGLLS